MDFYDHFPVCREIVREQKTNKRLRELAAILDSILYRPVDYLMVHNRSDLSTMAMTQWQHF